MLRNNLLRVRLLMDPSETGVNRALRLYYIATVVFLLLDLGLGINVRLSFLAGHEGWRMLYYLFCLGCLLIMLRRPAWTVPVAAIESLLTMVALILSTATRAMNPEAAAESLTIDQLVNFLLSGVAAYLSWSRSMTVLFGRS